MNNRLSKKGRIDSFPAMMNLTLLACAALTIVAVGSLVLSWPG